MKRKTFFICLLFYIISCPVTFSAGTIEWLFEFSRGTYSAPAIAEDGTIYIGGGNNLIAVNPDGSLKWTYTVVGDMGNSVEGSPAIGEDGTVYMGGNGKNHYYFYAINPDGTLKWRVNAGGKVDTTAAIGPDGTIFWPKTGGTLYASNPDGSTKWSHTFHEFLSTGVPVVSQDGTVYIGANSNSGRYLWALNNQNGQVKWAKACNIPVLTSPAIGIDGTIYAPDGWNMAAFAPDGTKKWSFASAGAVNSSPVVSTDGTVYFAGGLYIYALNSDGTEKWSYQTGGGVLAGLAIGKDGTIYTGSNDWYFYALNPDGTEKWSVNTGGRVLSSPAIGENGMIYVGRRTEGTLGGLLAITCENNSYQEDSPWPKFHSDNFNSGRHNAILSISPPGYDFGEVNLGANKNKDFFIQNRSKKLSFFIGTLALSQDTGQETSFAIMSDCSETTLGPGETASFTVEFTPVLNGNAGCTVSIPFDNFTSTLLLSGKGGGTENSALTGKVYDGSNGTVLPDASINMDAFSDTSGENGFFILSNIPPGTYTLSVEKEGYAEKSYDMEIPSATNVKKNLVIYPEGFAGIAVTDIASRFGENSFYLRGVNFEVEFTAYIDWDTHPPEKVKFITPSQTYEISTTENQVSRTFNMGTEFNSGETLKVQAVSSDSAISDEKEAKFTIMKPLPAVFPLASIDLGDNYFYNLSAGVNWKIFEEGAGEGLIPEDIPLFGSKSLILKLIPSVAGSVTSSGQASLRLAWEGLEASKKIESGKLAGLSFSLSPSLDISGQFVPSTGSWDWDGYAGLDGSASVKKSWPFIVWAGPVPIPMYAKASLSVAAALQAGIVDINPVILNGKVGINPYARGSLGAGADEIFAVEGWLGGGVDFGLQWPEKPTVEELTLYLNGGVTVYALLFKWENEALRWDWDILSDKYYVRPENLVLQPVVLGRDYIKEKNYASVKNSGWTTDVLKTDAKSYVVRYSTLEENVFPYSEAAVNSEGNYLYGAWLYDDISRNDLNRTKLVSSSWDGTSWTLPHLTVEDDGTPDFHPSLLTFADGTAAVIWEDGNQPLSESAVFDDMLSNLEISVAFYNPLESSWTDVTCLTSNGFLDRSPRLSGPDKNTLAAVWISSPGNQTVADGENPDKIYCSFRDGTEWSAPFMALEISFPVVKYSVAYNGTDLHIVLCLDKDRDTSTIEDRDLYLISRNSGIWTGLVPLLEDTTEEPAIDGNPSIFYDKDGNPVLLWIRNGKILQAVNLNMENREIVYDGEEYSTNLADFEICLSDNGRVGITWAEPSEFSSDIWAIIYQPSEDTWTTPLKLTEDEETDMFPAFDFYGEETLVGLYNSRAIDIEMKEYRTVSGKTSVMYQPLQEETNLAVLAYTMESEIGFVSGSLYINPENPLAGEDADIIVSVGNFGDKTISNIPVSFFVGNPDSGGVKIGDILVTSTLLPGQAAQAIQNWAIPALPEAVEIYAVLDPEETLPDTDLSNNLIHREFIKPDLSIKYFSWTEIFEDIISITANVANEGSIASPQTSILFTRDALDGDVLHQEALEPLEPNSSEELEFTIDVSGMDTNNLMVCVTADSDNTADEIREDNNTSCITLNPFLLPGDINRSGTVDISDVILSLRVAIGLDVTINGYTYEAVLLPSAVFGIGDINKSSNIDISDVILILRKSIGLE